MLLLLLTAVSIGVHWALYYFRCRALNPREVSCVCCCWQ